MKSAARTSLILLACATLVARTEFVEARAQRLSPADVAARLSGTWKLNLELSPSLGGSAPRGRGAGGPRLSVVFAGSSVQRRGRGQGGGQGAGGADLTPDQLAALTAMRQLQQIPPLVTITATAGTVTFGDARGERSFEIDGKKTDLDVAGAPVSVKTRWDKTALRQEFEITQSRLIQTWDVDATGHLVLTARVEGLTMRSADVKAFYDRQ